MINHVPDMYNLRGQTVNKFGLDNTEQIQYQFNTAGFRSQHEFDHCPKYALFGCSLIFGIGVENCQTTAFLLPDAYNFGLAGTYSNTDIYLLTKKYLSSDLYAPTTKICVVWTDRDQQLLTDYVGKLSQFPIYHFFCGDVIAGSKSFKFVKNLDYDVSGTHIGPKTHSYFSKTLWALLDR